MRPATLLATLFGLSLLTVTGIQIARPDNDDHRAVTGNTDDRPCLTLEGDARTRCFEDTWWWYGP